MSYPNTPEGGGTGRAGGGEQSFGAAMPAPAPAAARWVQWLGAATSVALILGVVVWGYKLAVRDVSGVPIIRALEGPARIAPEDPGGDLAAHVGLAVNEVAGAGVAAPGPERVVLAPEPEALAADDAPMAALRPIAPPPQPPEAEAGAGNGAGQGAMATPPVPAPPFASPAPAPAPVPDPGVEETAAADGGAPPQGTPETPTTEAPTTEAPAPESAPPDTAIAASVPGLARSPRPLPRPSRDLEAEAAAMAVAAALSGPAEIEIDAASLPEGTRVVQLGAFDSPEIARAEWDSMSERFAALMEGKKRIVQEAVSGGRSFWRLRVQGFETVEEARRFCAALVAEGANCIPTLAK